MCQPGTGVIVGTLVGTLCLAGTHPNKIKQDKQNKNLTRWLSMKKVPLFTIAGCSLSILHQFLQTGQTAVLEDHILFDGCAIFEQLACMIFGFYRGGHLNATGR